MKSIKAFAITLVLGVTGAVYAAGQQASNDVKSCDMSAAKASCCTPGASCCTGGSCCNAKAAKAAKQKTKVVKS
ncbi:MAG: hypothetical protein M3458_01855 [Acidobacteriota bacterium]|nr:hypothetical protein [Acidobacteriota bacterium]